MMTIDGSKPSFRCSIRGEGPQQIRAQTEVIGSILLATIVILSAVTFGAFFLDTVQDESNNTGATVQLTGSITTERVALSHNGGDSIDTDDLRVTVTVNGTDTGVGWASEWPGDGTFDPGETWRYTFSPELHPDATVTVRLVNTASNRVLFEDTRNPENAAAAANVVTAVAAGGGGGVAGGGGGDGDDGDGGGGGGAAPSVTSASLSRAPIDAGEASSTQTITVDFDEQMDQSVAPSVSLSGLTDGGGDYTVNREGWADGDTYEQTITFQGNNDDIVSDIEVSGARDTDGNTQDPDPATPSSFTYDTIRPGDANDVYVRNAPINSNNQDTIDVVVTNPGTVDGDETARVTLRGPNGKIATGSRAIQGGAGAQTVVPVDASTLDDGTGVTPTAYLEDDVGNTGGGVTNGTYEKDTDTPQVTQVLVEDAPIDDEDVRESGGQKITILFDDEMDQSIDPTVTITGLARSYTASPDPTGGFQNATGWTGIVDLRDDDEEATGTVEITGAEDTAGNRMSRDTSTTFEVDTLTGPSIAGTQLADDSANSNAEYELFYDIEDTASFDRVEVIFDNRNNDWGDQTVSNTAERGSVTFSQGGQEGSTFDVTVNAIDVNGDVVDTVTITDVADGNSQSQGDLTEGDSPEFTGTVVDDIGGDEANYEVSYNVTNRSSFGSVRVTYENLDSGGADATYTSSDPRNNIDDYAESSYGGTSGDEYRITIELLDDDGVVVDERVVTDVADGDDPSGNADLSRTTSPTLTSTSVKDKTKNNNGDYQAQYKVSDPDGEFQRVEVVFRNTDNAWATETKSITKTNGNVKYSTGGVEGDTYEIAFRVVDSDGIVVDETVITDVADGKDP